MEERDLPYWTKLPPLPSYPPPPTFYFIFTYYCPLGDLLALVVDNKLM